MDSESKPKEKSSTSDADTEEDVTTLEDILRITDTIESNQSRPSRPLSPSSSNIFAILSEGDREGNKETLHQSINQFRDLRDAMQPSALYKGLMTLRYYIQCIQRWPWELSFEEQRVLFCYTFGSEQDLWNHLHTNIANISKFVGDGHIPSTEPLSELEETTPSFWDLVYVKSVHYYKREIQNLNPDGMSLLKVIGLIINFLKQVPFISENEDINSLGQDFMSLITSDNGHSLKPPIAGDNNNNSIYGLTAKPKRTHRRKTYNNCYFCGALGHFLEFCPALNHFLEQGALIKHPETGLICFRDESPLKRYRKGMRHNPVIANDLKNALISTLGKRKELLAQPKPKWKIPSSPTVLVRIDGCPIACVAVIVPESAGIVMSERYAHNQGFKYTTENLPDIEFYDRLNHIVTPVGWMPHAHIDALNIIDHFEIFVVDNDYLDIQLGRTWTSAVRFKVKALQPHGYSMSITDRYNPGRSVQWESYPDSDPHYRKFSKMKEEVITLSPVLWARHKRLPTGHDST